MRPLVLIPMMLVLAGCGPTGCDTIHNVTATINAPARTTIDEKAVLAAELAYGAALDTVMQGVADGRITRAEAPLVASVIERASKVRPALHTALRAANQTDLVAKFNDLRQLTAELLALGAA